MFSIFLPEVQAELVVGLMLTGGLSNDCINLMMASYIWQPWMNDCFQDAKA